MAVASVARGVSAASSSSPNPTTLGASKINEEMEGVSAAACPAINIAKTAQAEVMSRRFAVFIRVKVPKTEVRYSSRALVPGRFR